MNFDGFPHFNLLNLKFVLKTIFRYPKQVSVTLRNTLSSNQVQFARGNSTYDWAFPYILK